MGFEGKSCVYLNDVQSHVNAKDIFQPLPPQTIPILPKLFGTPQ